MQIPIAFRSTPVGLLFYRLPLLGQLPLRRQFHEDAVTNSFWPGLSSIVEAVTAAGLASTASHHEVINSITIGDKARCCELKVPNML